MVPTRRNALILGLTSAVLAMAIYFLPWWRSADATASGAMSAGVPGWIAFIAMLVAALGCVLVWFEVDLSDLPLGEGWLISICGLVAFAGTAFAAFVMAPSLDGADVAVDAFPYFALATTASVSFAGYAVATNEDVAATPTLETTRRRPTTTDATIAKAEVASTLGPTTGEFGVEEVKPIPETRVIDSGGHDSALAPPSNPAASGPRTQAFGEDLD